MPDDMAESGRPTDRKRPRLCPINGLTPAYAGWSTTSPRPPQAAAEIAAHDAVNLALSHYRGTKAATQPSERARREPPS